MDIKEKEIISPKETLSYLQQPQINDFDFEEEDTSFNERFKSFWQYHEALEMFSISLICTFSFFVIYLLYKADEFVECLKLFTFIFIWCSFAYFLYSLFSVKLLLAAKSGKLEIIDRELKKGVNINITSFMDTSPAIFLAVQSGRLRTVKFLIERGADIHSFDTNGYTTLHYARTAKMAEYLLFLGVGIDRTRNVSNLTALHFAILSPRPDVVALLLARGADVNLESTNGKSALPLALSCRSSLFYDMTPIIEVILKNGADTKHGFTSCCCFKYESCESYAKIWSSSTINSMISKAENNDAF